MNGDALTMDSLSILLLLPIKDRVFVPRHHLLLNRHLRVPSFHGLGRLSLFRERFVHRGDYGIDCAKTFALTSFLEFGQPPWDLPIDLSGLI